MLAGFGLTDGQALSAVLAYRAVNFWLPIPFGGLAYASLELEHRSVRIRLKRRALVAPGPGHRSVATGVQPDRPTAAAPPATPSGGADAARTGCRARCRSRPACRAGPATGTDAAHPSVLVPPATPPR